jgi:GNAT superfamily N-acetyltransferase
MRTSADVTSGIRIAESDEEIERCFPIMQELRTHLLAGEFLERVRRQEGQGYRIVYLEEAAAVKAVAGFRLLECLASGRTLYVDDLVTAASERSRGHGEALIDWLVAHARAHACDWLQLDSGVQRADAHRFYFRQRLVVSSFHFQRDLREGG